MEFAYLPDVSTVRDEHTPLALGFMPLVDIPLDDVLPSCTMDTVFTGRFGKLFEKGQAGVKIFKTTDTLDKLMRHTSSHEMSKYRIIFNEVCKLGETQMIVKVTPVRTWRQLLTCFKEAMMTNRIYRTSRNDVHGSDYVCKPYMCTPIKVDKGWHFVFVSDMAEGVIVKKLMNFFLGMFHGVNKKQLNGVCTMACDKLWRLGFSHNDLHPGNVVYNPSDGSVKFIDLETAVEVPDEVVQEYLQARSQSNEDCYVTFGKVMLSPAMNMLRHSESWVNEFSHEEDGCKVLYNTDCHFLWALS